VDDPEYLFSPVDGAAKTERLIVEEFFPMNYTHKFHPSRFTRPGRFSRYEKPSFYADFIHLIYIMVHNIEEKKSHSILYTYMKI
jgi:hypothetical protein